MAYLHIGQNVSVEEKRIIGIFDLDNTSASRHTRQFLKQAEEDGSVISVCEDIPKSFLLCDHPYHKEIIYLSQLNPQTLQKRAENWRSELTEA